MAHVSAMKQQFRQDDCDWAVISDRMARTFVTRWSTIFGGYHLKDLLEEYPAPQNSTHVSSQANLIMHWCMSQNYAKYGLSGSNLVLLLQLFPLHPSSDAETIVGLPLISNIRLRTSKYSSSDPRSFLR